MTKEALPHKPKIKMLIIPSDLHTKIRIEAARRGIKLQQVGEEAGRMWLKTKHQKEAA